MSDWMNILNVNQWVIDGLASSNILSSAISSRLSRLVSNDQPHILTEWRKMKERRTNGGDVPTVDYNLNE